MENEATIRTNSVVLICAYGLVRQLTWLHVQFRRSWHPQTSGRRLMDPPGKLYLFIRHFRRCPSSIKQQITVLLYVRFGL